MSAATSAMNAGFHFFLCIEMSLIYSWFALITLLQDV
jgi:hypothetical protein